MNTGYDRPEPSGLPDLLADGPHPDMNGQLELFGQFVGTWDLRVRFFDADGSASFDGPGVWQFAWILDGRAIQDTVLYDNPELFPAAVGHRKIGTTVRSYHPSTNSWHQVWISPRAELFLIMQAAATTEGILVTGTDVDGSALRWSFSDITRTGFEWTGRTDQGRGDWRVEQRITATRHSCHAATAN